MNITISKIPTLPKHYNVDLSVNGVQKSFIAQTENNDVKLQELNFPATNYEKRVIKEVVKRNIISLN